MVLRTNSVAAGGSGTVARPSGASARRLYTVQNGVALSRMTPRTSCTHVPGQRRMHARSCGVLRMHVSHASATTGKPQLSGLPTKSTLQSQLIAILERESRRFHHKKSGYLDFTEARPTRLRKQGAETTTSALCYDHHHSAAGPALVQVRRWRRGRASGWRYATVVASRPPSELPAM